MGRVGRAASFLSCSTSGPFEAWGSPRLRGRVGVRQRHFLAELGPLLTGALLASSEAASQDACCSQRRSFAWDQPPSPDGPLREETLKMVLLRLMRTQAILCSAKRGSSGCQDSVLPGLCGRAARLSRPAPTEDAG